MICDNYCLLLHEGWDSGILGICSPGWSGQRPFPPGCILCCSLQSFSMSLPSHHYLPCSFLPSVQSHFVQLCRIHRFSCSISLTTQPLSLLSSTAQFQFQSVLSSVSWPQLLPVSLCNQMGQLLFCSWKYLNFQKCFYIFFLMFSKISLRILEIS